MLESKVSGGFSLTIYQARLDTSVSSLGTMSPQIQITYSGITVKTKTAAGMDRLPVWSETFNFEYLHSEFEVIAFHKPLLLKDIEIGRCKVLVEENSGWFELRRDGKKVGSIRIGIKEDRETWTSTAHTSKDSWDLRDDYIKKLNDLELEKEEATFYRKKYKRKLEKIRKNTRKSSGARGMDERNFEVSTSSERESEEIVGTLTAQVRKVQTAQEDLIKRKELLRLQEENINNEKERIRIEWEEVLRTRQEVGVLKQRVIDEYQRVKQEQVRIGEQVKQAELVRQWSSKQSREQMRYQQIRSRLQRAGSPERVWECENLTERRSLSIEEMHEKTEINRIPFTVEKPRPPLHPLSANSSRLITFE